MLKKGFTFIELIIYIALIAIILNVGVYFIWQMIEGKAKNVAYLEVENNLMLTFEKISYQAQRAKLIDSPSQGEESDQLILTMPDDSDIKFYLENNSLFLEKNNISMPLTNQKVIVEDVIFKTFIHQSTAPGSFQVKIKVSYNNPLGRGEYQAEIFGQKTLTLRDNIAPDGLDFIFDNIQNYFNGITKYGAWADRFPEGNIKLEHSGCTISQLYSYGTDGRNLEEVEGFCPIDLYYYIHEISRSVVADFRVMPGLPARFPYWNRHLSDPFIPITEPPSGYWLPEGEYAQAGVYEGFYLITVFVDGVEVKVYKIYYLMDLGPLLQF